MDLATEWIVVGRGTCSTIGCGNLGREPNMEDDYAAWHALVGAHLRTLGAFDRRLMETAGLSCGEFEILKHLKESGGRLRMSRLADLVYTSRSGLTRRIDRMQQRHLVERESAAEDGRGQYAVLQAEGEDTYERCLPSYRDVLLEGFGEILNQEELASLTSLLTRLIDSESAVQVD